VQWQDQNTKPYAEEGKYQVRIKPEGGNYNYYNTKKNATSHKLTGLTPNTTYYWNVKAIGNGKDIKDSKWAVSGNDWKFTTK
jgi:hypothetical protein